MKEVLVVLASVTTIVISGFYTRKAMFGDKVPHVVTWALLTVITALACAVQLQAGAGLGAIVLLLTAVFNATNFVCGLRKHGGRDVTPLSVGCFVLTLAAVVLWRISGDPAIAAICLTTAGVTAFVPTFARTWRQPQLELQWTYWANTGRYALAAGAVTHYSLATVLYPATWVMVNGGFSLYHAYCLHRTSTVLPLAVQPDLA